MNYSDPVQARIHRERVKRRQAEVRRDEWREKYRQLQADRLSMGDWPKKGDPARLKFLEYEVHNLRTRNRQLQDELEWHRQWQKGTRSTMSRGELLDAIRQLQAQVARLESQRPLGSFLGYR